MMLWVTVSRQGKKGEWGVGVLGEKETRPRGGESPPGGDNRLTADPHEGLLRARHSIKSLSILTQNHLIPILGNRGTEK